MCEQGKGESGLYQLRRYKPQTDDLEVRTGELRSGGFRNAHASAPSFAGGDEVSGDEGGFDLIVAAFVPAEGGAEGLVAGAVAEGAEGFEEEGLCVFGERGGWG